MHFAPDTVESLEFAVLLGNTHELASRTGSDELVTVSEVQALITQFRFSGRIDRDDDEVAEVRDVRDRIRGVWKLTRDDALAERIQAEVGLALVDVVRSDAMWRLRRCEAPDCEGLMADLSRNGSRRFCSIRCGNRMNQIAYRERQASDN